MKSQYDVTAEWEDVALRQCSAAEAAVGSLLWCQHIPLTACWQRTISQSSQRHSRTPAASIIRDRHHQHPHQHRVRARSTTARQLNAHWAVERNGVSYSRRRYLNDLTDWLQFIRSLRAGLRASVVEPCDSATYHMSAVGCRLSVATCRLSLILCRCRRPPDVSTSSYLVLISESGQSGTQLGGRAIQAGVTRNVGPHPVI